MLPRDLERRLSDLIAFQCVLVALHGAGRNATEEMLWQTFLSARGTSAVGHQVGGFPIWQLDSRMQFSVRREKWEKG